MKKSYEHTREIKRVSFNLEREAHLLKWIKDNKIVFSEWVKEKIKEEMKC